MFPAGFFLLTVINLSSCMFSFFLSFLVDKVVVRGLNKFRRAGAVLVPPTFLLLHFSWQVPAALWEVHTCELAYPGSVSVLSPGP
jgi:hypothetical protein